MSPHNSLLLVNLFADAAVTQSADRRTLTERILRITAVCRSRHDLAYNEFALELPARPAISEKSNLVNHVPNVLLQTEVGTQPHDAVIVCLLALSTDEASHNSAIRGAEYDTRSTFEELGVALESRPVNNLTSQENHDQFAEKGMEDDPKLPDDSPDTYLGKTIQTAAKNTHELTLSLTGDKRGPRCTVYDICDAVSPQDSVPYLPPKGALRTPHKPHQVEYMRSEGALTTLPADVCDDMIWAYFKHVHFFLPIVDAQGFLNDYHEQGPHEKHDLLFWSMMLAATNFADTGLLRRSGFPSRKAMKTSMYERAKKSLQCLYDLDRATEKLKLIQSVMLLSFWYTDPQDHTGAWYWIGIAISLAQGIGLHRNPRSSGRARQIHPQEQALRRRIWWSCVVRDRWVSLAKGRPMRIHSEDCDLPFPTSQDVLQELDSVADDAKRRFIPADSAALTSLWLRLVRISDVLGGILRLHYRVSGPDPTMDDIDKYAQQVESLSATNSGIMDEWGDALSIHAYQIDLFYQSVITFPLT
ncbi:cutinase transcription factor 1 beta [Fusarium sp. NRRL 52700]|nr:cutinase transcription factor 1 beta [Fusarium sp. NRRL 52700]